MHTFQCTNTIKNAIWWSKILTKTIKNAIWWSKMHTNTSTLWQTVTKWVHLGGQTFLNTCQIFTQKNKRKRADVIHKSAPPPSIKTTTHNNYWSNTCYWKCKRTLICSPLYMIEHLVVAPVCFHNAADRAVKLSEIIEGRMLLTGLLNFQK